MAILRVAQSYFHKLHLASGQIAAGVSLDKALSAIRPPLHFKVKPAFTRQAQSWRPEQLAKVLARLNQAEVECKRTGAADHLVVSRCLLAIALIAPGYRKRR